MNNTTAVSLFLFLCIATFLLALKVACQGGAFLFLGIPLMGFAAYHFISIIGLYLDERR